MAGQRKSIQSILQKLIGRITNMGIGELFNIRTKQGSTVTINGKTYHGSVVMHHDGTVIVNGQQADCVVDRIIKVQVDGDVDTVSTVSGEINITGNVSGKVRSTSGDITVGQGVKGDIETTSGDINVSGDVSGDASTVSGDIRYKR